VGVAFVFFSLVVLSIISIFNGVRVEYNLGFTFAWFLFYRCFCCWLDGVVALNGWLDDLTMVWILLFGLLCGGNLLSRIMSMHCIQVIEESRSRIEHFRKSNIKNKITGLMHL
jgi:hypothetical protein